MKTFKVSGTLTYHYRVEFEVEAESIEEVEAMERWRMEDHAESIVDRYDEPSYTDFDLDEIKEAK